MDKRLKADTEIKEIRDMKSYYSKPENTVEIQLVNDRNAYVWQNMSGFFKTRSINRDGEISRLEEAKDEHIGKIIFGRYQEDPITVDEFFEESRMDSMIVVKEGKVIYERYKTMRPWDKHNWFSVGKTVSSTLISILAEEGRVDIKKGVSRYIPELIGSQWDSVTIEETMDMATGLDSTEHDDEGARMNPDSGWYRWAVGIGLFHSDEEKKEDVYSVLRGMKRVKSSYECFEYNSINTFVLEMIVENVTGKPMSEVFSERVWTRTGMQNDAYVAVTKDGNSMGFGFISSTLRDLARYGMIFTPGGKDLYGEEIVSERIIREIQTGGREEIYSRGRVGQIIGSAFPEDDNIRNRYQWDAVFEDGDFYKGGVGGQGLYISPVRDVVIAWFASGTEHHEENMAREIAKYLC